MTGKHEALDDDVDIINLIDLMVVLCAMLMLLLPATSVLHELRGVPAGTGTTATAVTDLAQSPIVRFTAAEEVFWNDTELSLDDVSAQPRPEAEAVVFVAGYPAARYEFSIAVRSRLQAAGWQVKELLQPEGESP